MATVLERYNVAAGKPYTTRDGQDKKQWVSIGRATKWDDGGISIEFTSIPVGNWWDGKASLFVDDGQRQQPSGDRQQSSRPARQQSAPQGGVDKQYEGARDQRLRELQRTTPADDFEDVPF